RSGPETALSGSRSSFSSVTTRKRRHRQVTATVSRYLATAAASACGEGGRSGTLAGCADVRPLAAPTPISCLFSHAPREAVLLDHHGRFAPRSYDLQPSRARSRHTESHRHPEGLVRMVQERGSTRD